MSLRDVLARLLPDALDGYGDPERWADSFMRDPALAAAERVLAAADRLTHAKGSGEYVAAFDDLREASDNLRAC